MISFRLNGEAVSADPDETLFDIARRTGLNLPHLCSGYHRHNRADGSCRLCVVEVEGERTLTAACMRTPVEGMVVHTHSERVNRSRSMIMELLLADHPPPRRMPRSRIPFLEDSGSARNRNIPVPLHPRGPARRHTPGPGRRFERLHSLHQLRACLSGTSIQ